MLAAFFVITAFQNKPEDNPLLTEWKTPYNIPPFDKIKTEHFMPAYLEAIKRHDAEIEAIVSNKEKPTFENTILAYDKFRRTS